MVYGGGFRGRIYQQFHRPWSIGETDSMLQQPPGHILPLRKTALRGGLQFRIKKDTCLKGTCTLSFFRITSSNHGFASRSCKIGRLSRQFGLFEFWWLWFPNTSARTRRQWQQTQDGRVRQPGRWPRHNCMQHLSKRMDQQWLPQHCPNEMWSLLWKIVCWRQRNVSVRVWIDLVAF